MKANLLGYDNEDCGFEVFDENENRHVISIDWEGKIVQHATKDYPNKREDRTQEEQRICSQVEERARYAAQQEFPDADILDPSWDIDHLKNGLSALVTYPPEDFHNDFRDFYEALQDPRKFTDDRVTDLDKVMIFKIFRVENEQITEVEPVLIRFQPTPDESIDYGSLPEYPPEEQVTLALPILDFGEDFSFKEDFPAIPITHLMAQIRDLYLNMGEEPPEKFQVKGIGKIGYQGYEQRNEEDLVFQVRS